MRRRPVLRVSDAPAMVADPGVDLTRPPERVALVASWIAGNQTSRSLSELVRQLARHGYQVIVTIASDPPRRLEWPHGLDPATVVLTRPNVGYDFGSWAAAMDLFPAVTAASRVLQVNDSLIGPFTALDESLAAFENSPTAVWGLVDSSQHYPHLQSFFVGYKDGVLADPRLRAFWRDIRVERNKWALIARYEIGLSKFLHRCGLRYTAEYPWQDVAQPSQNPSVFGWRRLLDRGFPFVKRELLLRPPPEVRDAIDVPEEVSRRHGQDVWAWV